jgi:hypothetical protein
MEGDKDLQGDQVPLAVQATNDDSIVSKRSAARFGYFNDEYLRAFVRKPPRRGQLINRGYYIRCFAIRSVLRYALHFCPIDAVSEVSKSFLCFISSPYSDFIVLVLYYVHLETSCLDNIAFWSSARRFFASLFPRFSSIACQSGQNQFLGLETTITFRNNI